MKKFLITCTAIACLGLALAASRHGESVTNDLTVRIDDALHALEQGMSISRMQRFTPRRWRSCMAAPWLKMMSYARSSILPPKATTPAKENRSEKTIQRRQELIGCFDTTPFELGCSTKQSRFRRSGQTSNPKELSK